MNSEIIPNILVWGLIVGTYGSYSFQYYRLFKKKNVLGVSESMLIFGVLCCLLNILGAIMENKTNIHQKCVVTHGECYSLLTGLIQLSSPYVSSHIFYIMFYHYSKTQVLNTINVNKLMSKLSNVKLRFYIITIVTLLLTFYTAISFIYLPQYNNSIANNVFNTLSCVFGALMWIPQIYQTYVIKGNYSLSVVAIFIHWMGCIVTIFYQLYFNSQGFMVILPYIFGAFFELVVIFMCVYYQYIGINKKHEIYQAFIDE
jgi:hypothetical protein